jgi:hypothetical protein
MHYASFTLHRSELLKALDRLHVTARRSKKIISATCEITIIDNHVKLYRPGVTIELDCATEKTAKITISLRYFIDIIKSKKEPVLKLIATDDTLQIGTLKVPVKTSFFDDDSILRTTDLPVNYNDTDLLLLRTGRYTKEELEFNGLTQKIRESEIRLEDHIRKAFDLLKPYKVRYKDLESLVAKCLMEQKK